MRKSFDKWCDELDEIARECWPEQGSYTKDTGRECWKDMFSDGMTPDEAWQEEMYAAALGE